MQRSVVSLLHQPRLWSLSSTPPPSRPQTPASLSRTYASSSRKAPTAFDTLGFHSDSPGEPSSSSSTSCDPPQTPPEDVRLKKKAWKAQANREKEALQQARLERMQDEVVKGKRRAQGDWQAHLRHEEGERRAAAAAAAASLGSAQVDTKESKRRREMEKFLGAKAAKAKRAADRIAQEQARMRLEEAMQRAAYELYGSRRRTSANAPSKIYDHDAHYAHLAISLSTMTHLPTDDEVKDAWRKRMRAVHPDVLGGSTEKASRVNQAFEALRTDVSRRAYQRKGAVLSSAGSVYR